MIDQSAAEKAMTAYSEKARRFRMPAALHAALEAYEASRPKPVTITGLPDKLPDGTRIVGWRLEEPGEGDNWYDLGRGWQKHVSAYDRLIAITEADNG